MSTQNFVSVINGIPTAQTALVTSTGTASAGQIVATASNGMLDPSLYSSSGTIPEVTSDPASPSAGQLWVLYQPAGTPIGLLLSLTKATASYQLSYRTSEGTTVRVAMS